MVDAIRAFFRDRGVLEVETPLAGPGNVPDPEVTGLEVAADPRVQDCSTLYLQTSPELFMKRFVADARISCFQLCKAFRMGEQGRKHNPEFTLLEWYRVGFDTDTLIQEIVDLIKGCAAAIDADTNLTLHRTTYRAIFEERCNLDPALCDDAELQRTARRHGAPEVNRAEALSYLLAAVIEPSLPRHQITVVDRFPADQAALARTTRDPDGILVAERFEVFLGHNELANGYGELADADEQSRRFQRDRESRESLGLPNAGTQQHLIAALRSGLPECSGVALGVDRLLMALLGADDIGSVMAFR